MNNYFDTERFIEVTSDKQFQNGTVMFMDTFNPGIYYTACKSGTVNRVVVKNKMTITRNRFKAPTVTSARVERKYTCINYRQPNNGKFVKLNKLNDQLNRIQESSKEYNANHNFTTETRNNMTIITTPAQHKTMKK